MSLKSFFLGLLLAFGLPWVLAVVVPYSTMRGLEPVEFAGPEEDGGQGIYQPKRDGRITEGSRIYGQEGCYYCHTQLIRPTYAGSELWRKDWAGMAKSAVFDVDSRRETLATDYQDEKVAHVGISRVGPDLSNFGRRLTVALQGRTEFTPEQWIFQHLYNPREKKGYYADDQSLYSKSTCPSKPGLFKEVDKAQGRADGLPVEAPEGKAIIPTDRARALAGYLLSLKKDTFNAPLPKSLNYAPAASAAAK